jgi:hypothetical protein
MWISVEDKLPDSNDAVLAYETSFRPEENHTVTAWYGVSLADHPNVQPYWRYLSSHDMASVQGEVTHWMPLPKPPCSKLLGGSRKPHE